MKIYNKSPIADILLSQIFFTLLFLVVIVSILAHNIVELWQRTNWKDCAFSEYKRNFLDSQSSVQNSILHQQVRTIFLPTMIICWQFNTSRNFLIVYHCPIEKRQISCQYLVFCVPKDTNEIVRSRQRKKSGKGPERVWASTKWIQNQFFYRVLSIERTYCKMLCLVDKAANSIDSHDSE